VRAWANTPARQRRRPATPRSSAEEAAYQQLSTLPFGSWFDIDTGDGMRRQRLSWYSLLTGHALFVNPRGQKIADTDLDTLARQISAGRAQLVTEDKGRLVDRAWQASLGALRALAGGRAQETPHESQPPQDTRRAPRRQVSTWCRSPTRCANAWSAGSAMSPKLAC
jgi:hypothetical protein